MKLNIISFIIIAFGAICVAQLTIQITNQCECSQYDQSQCGTQYSGQSCQWNSTSCVRKGCSNLSTSTLCLQNFAECYWNGMSCQQFNSCSQLNYKNISCSQQNIQCGQFTGNSTSCMPLEYLPECSNLNQTQCTSGQIAQSGTLCYWNSTGYCQKAASCAVFVQENECAQYSKACFWNYTIAGSECVQAQCQDYANEMNCTYVIQGLNPKTIQPCQYKNGICQPIPSSQELNAQNCSSKTLSTYHWIQAQNSTGICIPCVLQQYPIEILNQYQPNNKCSCSNYLSQQCQSSKYCTWSKNQCIPTNCNQLFTQISCLENLKCSWQNNTCQPFENCPKANNLQGCLENSFNCLFYNNNQCYSLSNNVCHSFNSTSTCQSQLGYCYWSGNQCNQVEQCNQLPQQSQCLRFGYSCVWQNNKCQSLTCNMIGFENKCIYTIPTLYTNDVQPCIWQNSTCQNLTNQNSLNSEQCQLNTLDTYKWTGSNCVQCSQAKQSMMLLLQLPYQCSCTQLFSQSQCVQSSYCIWQNNSCYDNQYCQNINNQFSCSSNPRCFWDTDKCSKFISCQVLQGKTQQDCIVQSINCPATNGTNCLEKKSLQACSTYASQSTCQNALGNSGICFWQNDSCQVLYQCQQITKQQDCQYFEKQCSWSTSCQPASCSTFTSATCSFYYTSINSFIPVPCYWNSKTGVCTQTTDYMTQLNSNTCETNTNLNARWSQTLKVCLSCQAPPPPNPLQCTCAQLVSKQNCVQSQQCYWNQQILSCQQLPCTNLKQLQCIQNSQCMWNISCQPFTSCKNLQATSSDECAAQTLYCPYYNSNNKQCQADTGLGVQSCNNLTQQNCNILTQYYICQWNQYSGTDGECETLNTCKYYSYNKQSCENIQYCYFELECKPKLCHQFQTKESCKFAINLSNWNYIQSCVWLNGACVSAQNQLSEQNCYTNTDQTARWSSNIQDGFCIPCNLPLQQTMAPKNKCLCSQLLTQDECQYFDCYWNNENCFYKLCEDYSWIDCIKQTQCYWNYQHNQCADIDYFVYPDTINQCILLHGNNSLECLSQSLYCPVSLNGICQSRELLQTCQSLNSLQLCANSIGQEGYCTYENQQCQVLTGCLQLKTITECVLFDKTCQWNQTTGACEQLSCSSYTNQGDCTYIFQNINKANIQICVWNAKTNICSSATYLIEQSYSTCLWGTGGTYHWSSPQQTSGYCISCSLNKLRPKNTCSCTLLNEIECSLSKPLCRLNQNSQCQKVQCNEILESVICSQQDECMWNQNKCVSFSKCSDLTGLTNLDCIAQSLQCQSISNGICQPTSNMNKCDQNAKSDCTFGKLGSDGFCDFNVAKNVCQVISSCDKVYNQNICQSLIPACKWSYAFSSCVPFQCQDYNDEDDCTNVIVNLSDPQVELCVWQNQKCVPFVDTYYRFDDAICYVNSDHTYRWIQEDKVGVRCQQCLQAFLINFIAIILLSFL